MVVGNGSKFLAIHAKGLRFPFSFLRLELSTLAVNHKQPPLDSWSSLLC